MTGAILNTYKGHIQEITLVASDGGRFEVSANDELVYSKIQTGRHAEPSEVLDSLGKMINEEKE